MTMKSPPLRLARSRRAAWLHRAIGLPVLAVGVLAFLRGLSNGPCIWPFAKDGCSLTVAVVSLLVAAFCLVTGAALLRQGRRFSAPRAADVLADDHRPPVLYLRSFRDDTAGARSTPAGNGLPASLATEEEQIERALRAFGPVVAVGSPTEYLPPPGVARFYPANWRASVLHLMAQAQLVVLRIGASEGLWWEIEQVAARVDPKQVILLIPADRRLFDEFRQRASERLGWRLPEYTCRRGPYGSLSGYVMFEAGWVPRYVPFGIPRHRRGGPHLMTSMLTMSLGPVYKRLGVPWQPPAISPLGIMMWTIHKSVEVTLALTLLSWLLPEDWKPSEEAWWPLAAAALVVILGQSLLGTLGYILAYARSIRQSLAD